MATVTEISPQQLLLEIVGETVTLRKIQALWLWEGAHDIALTNQYHRLRLLWDSLRVIVGEEADAKLKVEEELAPTKS